MAWMSAMSWGSKALWPKATPYFRDIEGKSGHAYSMRWYEHVDGSWSLKLRDTRGDSFLVGAEDVEAFCAALQSIKGERP